MAHLQGKRYSSAHTTVIDAAIPVARKAAQLDCVSKIVLGVIKSVRGRSVEKRLKMVDVAAGLLITVRGNKSVQNLYIYTTDRDRTKHALQAVFLAAKSE